MGAALEAKEVIKVSTEADSMEGKTTGKATRIKAVMLCAPRDLAASTVL